MYWGISFVVALLWEVYTIFICTILLCHKHDSSKINFHQCRDASVFPELLKCVTNKVFAFIWTELRVWVRAQFLVTTGNTYWGYLSRRVILLDLVQQSTHCDKPLQWLTALQLKIWKSGCTKEPSFFVLQPFEWCTYLPRQLCFSRSIFTYFLSGNTTLV